MGKHQCEYCCWYVEEIGCECPYIMKETACRKARDKKQKEENYEKRE